MGVKKTLDPSPTHPPYWWVGGGGTHVALFRCTVFNINLFQLGYYMSVHYKHVNIINNNNVFTIVSCLVGHRHSHFVIG